MLLKQTIGPACGLGECILWDDQQQQLLWTDMPGRRLYCYSPDDGVLQHHEFDQDLCSFGLLTDSDCLIAAFQRELAMLDRSSGERTTFFNLDAPEVIRLNDGRVDRQGRFWVGSLVDEVGNHPRADCSGKLYSVDGARRIRTHFDGIGISNSICWSPDGTTMYFADTPRREIYQFDFDLLSGSVSNKRLFARTPNGASPDGSIVDAEGFLWNAEWGQGHVKRYAPDGSIDFTLQLPTSHVTCLTFGGPDLSDLYVTTATYGLSEQQLAEQALAGHVFVYATDFQGLPESRYGSPK